MPATGIISFSCPMKLGPTSYGLDVGGSVVPVPSVSVGVGEETLGAAVGLGSAGVSEAESGERLVVHPTPPLNDTSKTNKRIQPCPLPLFGCDIAASLIVKAEGQ